MITDNAKRETVCLFNIYCHCSNYPHGFIKDETPDWRIENKLSLEIVTADSPEDYELYYDIGGKDLRLKDYTSKSIKTEGYAIFETTFGGTRRLIKYLFRKRTIRLVDDVFKEIKYDELNADEKKLIDNSKMFSSHTSFGLSNPYDYVDLCAFQFEEKTKKLQQYGPKYSENHLFIYSIQWPDVRGIRHLIKLMKEIAVDYPVNFDVVFINTFDHFIQIDMKTETAFYFGHTYIDYAPLSKKLSKCKTICNYDDLGVDVPVIEYNIETIQL